MIQDEQGRRLVFIHGRIYVACHAWPPSLGDVLARSEPACCLMLRSSAPCALCPGCAAWLAHALSEREQAALERRAWALQEQRSRGAS